MEDDQQGDNDDDDEDDGSWSCLSGTCTMRMTFYKMMKEIMMMMMVCDLLFLHLYNENDLNVCRMINKMIT